MGDFLTDSQWRIDSLSDVVEWNIHFELIYSNEIFISLNKNHCYFLQFNEVLNYLVFSFFDTYQILCELFFLRSTIESLVVSCSA